MQESQLISEEQTTYHYNELPEGAKDVARRHYIEHWVHDDWYDYIYIEAKDDGAVQGFDVDDIFFSGFWSQGDGAMWTGTVDLPEFITHYLPESIGRDCWLWLIEDGWVEDRVNAYRTSHHYSHSNCMGVTSIGQMQDNEEDTLGVDCILKGAPISTLYNLILADTACSIKDISDLEELVLNEARRYADMIYGRLRDGYEYECSDAQISECYDANNVLFNEEGKAI
jgi:hypothetical protein